MEHSFLSELKGKTVKNLQAECTVLGISTSGAKADLILKIVAKKLELRSKEDTNVPKSIAPSRTYDELITDITTQWNKDLRQLPTFSFIQLYNYLVLITHTYDDMKVEEMSYKSLKAFKFFVEGHLRKIEVSKDNDHLHVKALVKASMRSVQYKVLVTFINGVIHQAVCTCPAGLGLLGKGKCNHVGGLLFAIEDFNRRDLKEHPTPLSCTSRLSVWTVPRNLKVDSKPISQVLIRQIKYGRELRTQPRNNTYDPRAPQDRGIDESAFNSFSKNLAKANPTSAFFLYHDIAIINEDPKDVIVDSDLAEVPTDAPDVAPDDIPFNDSYDISSSSFGNIMEYRMDCDINAKLNEEEQEAIQMSTKGQHKNRIWRELKEVTMTASNFGQMAKRKADPTKLLETLMGYKRVTGEALAFGITNEDNAVRSYAKRVKKVEKVGLIVSKEYRFLGASLDGLVTDLNGEKGGLEVKCPMRWHGKTIQECVESRGSYLQKMENGEIMLKRNHNYYYQVQGQMFCSGLNWVDFVVWLGKETSEVSTEDDNDVIHVERLHFDKAWFEVHALLQLRYFYKHAFLPEVITRRVKRKLPLYIHGGWQCFKDHK